MRLTEFEKIAELLAKQHKIRVKEGPGWAANIKQREVFYKKNDIYDLTENHILGLLLHEIAHIHYSTTTASHATQPELFRSIMNMLEDHAIENLISHDYTNAGEILAETKGEVIDTLMRLLPTLECSLHEKCLLYASVRFEGRGYQFPMTKYEIIGDEIKKLMETNRKEILERNKTKDLIPISEDILQILLKEIGEPTEKEKESLKETEPGEKKIDENGKIQKTNTTKDKIIQGLRGKNKGNGDEDSLSANTVFIDKITDKSNLIGKQIRSILKINNAMEFGGRYKTGKLKTKNIIRTRTIKDRRPFGRRIIKSNKSYSFSIAADVSGSMFFKENNTHGPGTPYDIALSTMYMVSEALKVANIPKSLIIFGENAVLLSPSTTKGISWNTIDNKSKLQKAGKGGTEIADGIKMATKQLLKEKTERKIIIILTDGGDHEDSVHEAIKKANKEGIECMGITIGDYPCLSECLPKENHTFTEETPDQICNAFVKILKTTITKSN